MVYWLARTWVNCLASWWECRLVDWMDSPMVLMRVYQMVEMMVQ